MCGITCGIIFELDISALEKLVFLSLAWLIDDNAICFPGIAYLRRRTGLSKDCVLSCIDKLIKRNFLMKVTCFRPNGSQTCNAYKIINVVPENLMHLVGSGKGRQGRIDPTIFEENNIPTIDGGVRQNDPGGYATATPGGTPQLPLDHISNDKRFNLTIKSYTRDAKKSDSKKLIVDKEHKEFVHNIKVKSLPKKIINKKPKISSSDVSRLESLFITLWQRYPRSEGKARAFKAFCDLNPTRDLFEKILDGVEQLNIAVKNGKEIKYCKMLEGYLNQKRWEDKVITNQDGKNERKQEPRHYSIAERIYMRQEAERKQQLGETYDMVASVFPKNE